MKDRKTRRRRAGEPDFWQKVDMSGGPDACWPWLRSVDRHGYGIHSRWENWKPKFRRAHRVAWSFKNKTELTPDVFICHSCDNPPCCNPAHLWPGTQADNIADKERKGRGTKGKARPHTWKVVCKRGHLFTEENTLRNAAGGRKCRQCNKDLSRESRLKIAAIADKEK